MTSVNRRAARTNKAASPPIVSANVPGSGTGVGPVVWVTPLKGHAEYEPLAGGMRAALPFVDRFLSGHDVASLESLGRVLGGIERRHAA